MNQYPRELIELIKSSSLKWSETIFPDHGFQFCSKTAIKADLIALVAILGEDLSGIISIVTTAEFLKKTHPNDSESTGQISDWYCELCNILTGMIKGEFVKIGTEFIMSVPQTYSLVELTEMEEVIGPRYSLNMTSQVGEIQINFSLTYTKNMDFTRVAETSKVIGAPSSLSIF